MTKSEKNIETVEKNIETVEINNDYIVKFNKPYKFEGQEYTEIDLNSIENLTANDLIEADKLFIAKGLVDPIKEVNLTYCLIIAYLKTNKPLEFYTGLRANEAIKIKAIVSSFLMQ